MRRSHAAILGVLAAAVLGVVPSPVSAQSASATLQVLPSLRGTVGLDPAGVATDGTGTAVTECGASTANLGCAVSYPLGTVVTLTPHPAADAGAFVTWSEPDCESPDACAVTVDEPETTATVTYTTQSLLVSDIGGEGTITDVSGTLGIDCPGTCSADVAYGTPVVLQAQPTGTGVATWLRGCDEGPHTGPTCTATVTTDPWPVLVAFDDTLDPGVPPRVESTFQIRRSGDGVVRGGGLACGGSCSARYAFGTKLTLTADPDAGAAFDHWSGACGSHAACTVPVGPITAVRAIFVPLARAADDAPSPSQPPDASPPTPPPSAPAVVRSLSVRAGGRGSHRRVRVAFVLDRRAAVRAVLARGARTVATRATTLGAGRHTLTIRVPRHARAGVYRLRIRATGGGAVTTLTRTLRLRS